VLAYNAFTRLNRAVLADLDGFAHDVRALLAGGRRGAEAGPAAEPPAGR
jgi:biopolymer transport protein ExbB